MLIKGIGLISAILTVVGFILGIYEAVWAIPIAFVVLFVAILLVWVLGCSICAAFIDLDKQWEKHNPICRFYANGIMNIVMWFLRIKMHITGMENLPKEKFLLVGNHRGAMDPLITMAILKKYNMGFVAKKELFKIPVISKLMHTCFCLSLNRGDVKDSAKTILRAGEIVKEGKASMGIYPEGTRNTGDEMLPFMHGAFKIAKKAECDIVVATIKNTEHIMKNMPFRRTHVYLDFIGVIGKDVVAENTTVKLSEMAREMMEEHLKK
ncbi:MAG: 1-acyl-sn-glycerol-3-phosphate acyltransferase [Lachnospiraceae bacterium]|nr:1-acyl-sn-glycerol-3-phosphate acyltransferase [Lachnospiraceae bacterium]